MANAIVRKTPYYAAVSKGVLDIAKMYDDLVVIRLALLFTNNRSLKNVSENLLRYMGSHIRRNPNNLDKFVLIKCQDINKKEAKVLKIYDKETNKIVSRLNTLLTLL